MFTNEVVVAFYIVFDLGFFLKLGRTWVYSLTSWKARK